MEWQRRDRGEGMARSTVRALAAALLLAPGPSPAEEPGGEDHAARAYSAAATVGWGYYELLHVGAELRLGERSTLGALIGSNLGTNGTTDWSAGLSYAHAVGQPLREIQLGGKVEALYWTQSDPDYDWKLLTLVASATAARPITSELSVGLDLGVAWTATLASDRKQDVTFSDPQRWNFNVCVELKYRFKSW